MCVYGNAFASHNDGIINSLDITDDDDDDVLAHAAECRIHVGCWLILPCTAHHVTSALFVTYMFSCLLMYNQREANAKTMPRINLHHLCASPPHHHRPISPYAPPPNLSHPHPFSVRPPKLTFKQPPAPL